MSLRDDDQDKKDDGSIWTSYSDMFTTMAVIFLVMFVFAILRSGVSTLTMVKNKKEQQEKLKGKIPEAVVQENKKKKEKLQESIQEMDQFNQVINEKLAQINTFSQKMMEHQTSIKHLLKDQEEKEAIVKNLREDMLKKDHKLVLTQQDMAKVKAELQVKVTDLEQSFQKNRELQIKKEELTTKILEWENQVEVLKKNFEHENTLKQQKITELDTNLSQKLQENQELSQNLAQEREVKENKIQQLRELEVRMEKERQ